jgi:hypothetical protein
MKRDAKISTLIKELLTLYNAIHKPQSGKIPDADLKY